MVPTLAGYTNLQKLKIEGFLEQQSIIILIDAESTHKFMSSKVAAHLMLQKEYYNGFEVKVANGQILKCNQKCPRIKLVLQEQDIVADFFILPLDGFEIVLGIDWLLAKVKSTYRVDAFGNSPGVCQKLAEGIRSLPGWRKGVPQKKTETPRKIVKGSRKACRESGCSDDVVGSRRKFAMRFAEGIGKLAGNAKGDHREEDRRTCLKIAGG
ncbi:hypothetical protein GW17_00051308 [Ensete ventricosum]|nr:hypothetical protein GW17_00051308 [Ensete ventricosum]